MELQCLDAMLRSTASPSLPPLQSVRLLDQMRERVRYLHYSLRTEQAYVYWVRAFVRHLGLQHPRDVGLAEVGSALTWLRLIEWWRCPRTGRPCRRC